MRMKYCDQNHFEDLTMATLVGNKTVNLYAQRNSAIDTESELEFNSFELLDSQRYQKLADGFYHRLHVCYQSTDTEKQFPIICIVKLSVKHHDEIMQLIKSLGDDDDRSVYIREYRKTESFPLEVPEFLWFVELPTFEITDYNFINKQS